MGFLKQKALTSRLLLLSLPLSLSLSLSLTHTLLWTSRFVQYENGGHTGTGLSGGFSEVTSLVLALALAGPSKAGFFLQCPLSFLLLCLSLHLHPSAATLCLFFSLFLLLCFPLTLHAWKIGLMYSATYVPSSPVFLFFSFYHMQASKF
ncbi:uncharacterized protein J3R85_008606 [Psidium guajava]|nr:uncharacterized protein J3R85_008606 [Psidium guajava]